MSRRAALTGIALAGAVIAPAAIAGLPSATGLSRAAWDRAFAVMQRAKAASDAEDARHEPIWQAYRAAVDAVPHISLGRDPYTGSREPLTTDNHWAVRDARRMVQEMAEGRRKHDPYPDLMAHEKLQRELAAAADARDAEIERIDKRLGYSQADDKRQAACDAWLDAEAVLFDMPAPDGPALLWKLEATWLGDEEAGYCKDRVSGILADARRLLSQGRA